MSSEIILLIVGAAIGFLSTVLVEFIKHTLDISCQHWEHNSNVEDSRKSTLRTFLESKILGKNTTPAWLKLTTTKSSLGPYLYTPNTKPAGLSKRHGTRVSVENRFANVFSKVFAVFNIEQQTSKANKKKVTRNMSKNKSPTLRKFMLSKTLVIGRQQDCEVRLYDLSISRVHAMIRYEEGNYVIYDLGSTTGTYVNGDEIKTSGTRLFNGDEILIGQSTLIFESADSVKPMPVGDDVIEAISKAETQQLKGEICEIHGPYSENLDSCPYCRIAATKENTSSK